MNRRSEDRRAGALEILVAEPGPGARARFDEADTACEGEQFDSGRRQAYAA
jgi:hypothetical protein